MRYKPNFLARYSIATPHTRAALIRRRPRLNDVHSEKRLQAATLLRVPTEGGHEAWVKTVDDDPMRRRRAMIAI
jgi:hypothetical protein